MAPTDNPLKQLIAASPTDFASWLLDAQAVAATPLDIELPADSLRADQLYRVQLEDGREVLLHLEFQGRTSKESMPQRMLEYQVRLLRRYASELCSVVLYLGQGAGANDSGVHAIRDCTGEAQLSWRYRVVRLWELDARELLALGRPALLALVGQTRLEEPELILPAVITQLHQVTPPALRSRLVSALLALLSAEELIAMAENILSSLEEDLMELPYYRRLRQEHEQGLEVGLEQGQLEQLRHDILEAVTIRFEPNVTFQESLARQLAGISDQATLKRLFTAALRAPSLKALDPLLPR